MPVNTNPKSSFNLWKIILSSIFGTLGLFLSIDTKIFTKDALDYLDDSRLTHIVTILSNSIKYDDIFIVFIVFIFICVVLYIIKKIAFTHREQIVSTITGVFFAFLFLMNALFSNSVKSERDLSALFLNNIQLLRVLIKFFGLILLCTLLVRLFFVGINYVIIVNDKKVFGQRIWLLFASFIVARIPYFIIFYPGVNSNDTRSQINMFFHYNATQLGVPFTQLTNVQAENIFITNHHPYFTTLIFGLFTKLGLLLGDINIGFAIYSICQILLYSMIFTGCILYLKRIGVTYRVLKAVTWFLILFPPISILNITMLKDSLFGIFNLVLFLMLFEIARSKGTALKSIKFNIGFILTAWLVMLTKNQGIYIVTVIAIICLICFIKYWKQIMCTLLLSVLLFQVGYISILLPALNVAPGGRQEALSVPFQQTARYIRDWGNEVTSDERSAIDAVLPYDELASLYDPEISDPVKLRFRQEATSDDIARYFKAWFSMLLKHPLTYCSATLQNIDSFFGIRKTTSFGYYEIRSFSEKTPELVGASNIDATESLRNAISVLIKGLQRYPGFDLFLSHGMYTLYIFLICADFIRRKNNKGLIAMIVPLLSVLFCVLGPSNGNFRYILPILFILPFALALETIPNRTLLTEEGPIITTVFGDTHTDKNEEES